MNGMRKVLGFFMVLMLAAFAMPASAADKLFTLYASTFTGSGTSIGNVIPSGTTSVLLLDFANQSPNGANSVMKSIQVSVPTDVSWKIIQTNSVNTTPSQTTVSCPTAPTYTGAAPTSTGAISLNNLTGVKPSGHFCLYLAVTSNLSACTPEIWTGYASTGNSLSGGTPFDDNTTQTQPYSTATTIDGCTGVLGCATGNNTGGSYGSLVLTQSGFEGQANWGIVRGNNWAGDLNCTLVPYQFNFQQISAEYVVVFNPIPYPGSPPSGAWPNTQPKLAWATTVPFTGPGGTPNYPADYVPAFACLDDDVNGANVLPTFPYVPLFQNSATYPAAQYPQYQAGQPALMCIANTGWTSMTLTAGNIFGLTPGPYIQVWFKIIDRADGYVNE